MSEPLTRFRTVDGCNKCDKPLHNRIAGDCCPYCGGTFLGGAIDHDYLLVETYAPIEIKWWNPATWSGGKWEGK